VLPRNATPEERRRFLEILSTPPEQPVPERIASRPGEVWPEECSSGMIEDLSLVLRTVNSSTLALVPHAP
jgi:hypothetical protein